MQLKIGDKEYSITLGFAALDYLDKVYYLEFQNGAKLGQGVAYTINYINDENPLVIYHMIKAGTITERSKPSNEDIEAFILETGEKGNLDKLFKDFSDELKKQPLTKTKVIKLTKQIAELEKASKQG